MNSTLELAAKFIEHVRVLVMHRNHGVALSLTLTDVKLPQTSKHLLARVRATFSRCGLLRKPTPAVLVVENIIMSFSCPWYESIVFTEKLNEDSSGVVLRRENGEHVAD